MSDTIIEQAGGTQVDPGEAQETQEAQENQERRRALPKVRRQTSFAAEDEAVLRWWDSQRDVALSLHDIIVEAIERNGYGDYHFREVEQKPRVGRPPRQASLPVPLEEADGAELVDDATVSEGQQVFRADGEPVEVSAVSPVFTGEAQETPEQEADLDPDSDSSETRNDPGAMDSLLDGI